MNWEAIGALGELVGGIVVVASVVYLAIQVRHNTRTSQDEANREIFSAAKEQFNTMAEPQNAAVILMGLENFDGLESTDRIRFDSLMHAFITSVELSVISNKAELILDETMENWAHYLHLRFFPYPGMAQWWQFAQGSVHPDAQAWINRQFEKTTDSDYWGISPRS